MSSAVDGEDKSSDASGKDELTNSDASEGSSGEVAKVDMNAYKHLFNVGPQRPPGLFTVDELQDAEAKTISFAKIDEVESDIKEYLRRDQEALIVSGDEEAWKRKLMFECGFKRTPKHLTWEAFGRELECMDISIELDKHRPEEAFTLKFFFRDKAHDVRDLVWTSHNEVSRSDALTDLLAAVGCGLIRQDMHRTIRFDDGKGTIREINLRKNSRFTSEVRLAFRPVEYYNIYEQTKHEIDLEHLEAQEGISLWGYHPMMMDPEYRDLDDPPGTYHLCISSHALAFMMLRALERLLQRPLKDFYRPSQIPNRALPDNIGVFHAVAGWLGSDEKLYPHFTPMEAIQDHWFGSDAPYTLTAIMNKLRCMTNLKAKNPEFLSWLSVRKRDTMTAIRNIKAKPLRAGAGTLFKPIGRNSTVNMLLPKSQRRKLRSRVSVAGVLHMPDETHRLDEYKKLGQSPNKLDGSSSSQVDEGEDDVTVASTGKETKNRSKRESADESCGATEKAASSN